MTDTRRCTKCGVPKDAARDFNKNQWWCRACAKAYWDAYYARPEKRQSHKDQIRHKTYGLSREDYRAMLHDQGGLCAICARPMEPPHVDHDHATGAVRGLLCPSCNKGIGLLHDDDTVLDRAASYLRRCKG